MALRKLKPINNSSRGRSYLSFSAVKKRKIPALLKTVLTKKSGRNNSGKVTVAHRGGGEKRLYRLVNFNFDNKSRGKVVSLEYDPNRTANIALIEYENGLHDYILAPDKLKIGATVENNDSAPARIGNRMKLKNIPIGTQIHNIEMLAGKGGKLCRSAGNYATLLSVENGVVTLKLPSGEVRKLKDDCFASIGAIGNSDVMNISFGKAGRMRHKGIRPTVRGKAKNAVDHPHGGGEGGTSIGMPHPKTPWGMPTLGYRTRNRKNRSSSSIIKRRS